MADEDEGRRTWEETSKWSQILNSRTKAIIRDALEAVPVNLQCPYLRVIREENEPVWVYCDCNCSKMRESGMKEGDRPSYNDPRYRACIDSAFFQIFCVDEDSHFRRCITYIGATKDSATKA